MAAFWESLATGLGLVLTGVGSVVGIRTEETPRYETIVKDGDHEIRRYAPYLVATTRASGSREEASNQSFRILAGYIFGNNRTRESISMTAPVVMTPESTKIPMTAPVVMTPDGESWEMAFVLPARFTRETLPVPVDPRVAIREMPAEDLAVVRFSGSVNQEEALKQERGLRDWCTRTQGQAYEAAGTYRFAGYDPPWTLPPLRRNEVMIPVKRRA